MASTEDIEAKLAAYVDGDLGDADRAEIETHLTTNPQHRQLIQELMEQRRLLKELPRQSAPPDVAESINAQLERAVLLGDVDDQSEVVSMRISRWPQIRAIAAVLVLTVGLAAAIYFLVPSNNKAPELADIRTLPTPSGPAPVSVAAPTAPVERMTKAGGEHGGALADDVAAAKAGGVNRSLGEGNRSIDASGVAVNDTEQQRRAKDSLANSSAVGGFGGGGGGARGGGAMGGGGRSRTFSNAEAPADKLFKEVVTDQMNLNGRQTQLASADNKSLVVVIPTSDLDSTNKSVKRYLSDNGIRWEQQAEPMPAPLELAQDQRVFASRLQRSRVQMKGGISQDALQQKAASTSPTTPSESLHEDVQQQVAVQKSLPETRQQLQQQEQLNDGAAGKMAQADAARAPAKEEMEKQQVMPQQAAQQPQQQVPAPLPTETPAAMAVQNAPEGEIQLVNGDGQQLIVAKQIPRAQAEMICNDLNGGKLAYGYLGVPTGQVGADAANSMKWAGNGPVGGASGGNMVAANSAASQLRDRAERVDETIGKQTFETAREQAGIPTSAPAPTTGPALALEIGSTATDRPITAGDTLDVNVPQLKGPGIEPNNSVQVTAGGTIVMPMLDEPIPAAGMTTKDLSDTIARKYREAKLIPEATATVVLGTQAGVPSTQPAQQGFGQADAFALTPTSQPAGDLVDVVILLRNEPPSTQPMAAAAAEPTTQPSPARAAVRSTTGPAQ